MTRQPVLQTQPQKHGTPPHLTPQIIGHPPQSRVLLQTSQQSSIFSQGCLSPLSTSDNLDTTVA